VAGEEVDLVGDDTLERLAEIDVEVAVGVEANLGATRSRGVPLGSACGSDGVVLADAEQRRAVATSLLKGAPSGTIAR
jgi:hypothetical protein